MRLGGCWSWIVSAEIGLGRVCDAAYRVWGSAGTGKGRCRIQRESLVGTG
jgi:hypothetical protein